MTNVNMFPKKTESDGESFFCFRNNKVRAAKLIPENTAKILPMIPSSVSLSIKNSANPINNISMVNQSIIVDSSFKNIYPNKAT